MNCSAPGFARSGLGKLSELLSRQNEGLTKEERESRLVALERIAGSVRVRVGIHKAANKPTP